MSVGNKVANQDDELNTQPSLDASSVTSSVSMDANNNTSGQKYHDNGNSQYYYLTPNAVKRLPSYQYSGADLSLLYKHVLSPLAGWCVDHITPTWLAPNAITLIGLCWMISSYCVIWYYCPGLYEANTELNSDYTVPPGIFLLNGCAMLIYQTLDNMDGKQARKTGSSSPLGLLFDHGCDALNSIFGSANWIAAMGLLPGSVTVLLGEASGGDNVQNKSFLSELLGGDVIIATLLILSPMIAFFVATWEQYFTGKLILPPVNGPSEGLVVGASLSFISYMYGPMIWQQTTWTDGAVAFLGDKGVAFSSMEGRVRNMDIVVLSSIFALIQELLGKVPAVIRSYGQEAMRTLLPHIAFVISTVLIITIDSTIFLRIPRTMCHLISALFVEQTTQLMLDHMVEENFSAFRWVMLPQIALAAAMAAGVTLSNDAVDVFFTAYTTGLWVYLALKLKVHVYEICDVLGIWCFDIVSPHPKSKRE